MKHHRIPFALVSAVLIATTAISFSATAQDRIPVVATFSILGDMVERVGGNHVDVTTLVGRDGDAHVFQPNPSDAKSVAKAKIMFTNGLLFEGWLERLAEAAQFNGELVVTTDGMKLITLEHGDEHSDHHDEDHEDDHGDEHSEGHADEHKGDHEHGEGHDDEHKDDHGHGNSDAHDDEHTEDHHAHGEFDPHGWQSLRNAITYVDNITAALAKIAPHHAASFYENRASYVSEIEMLDEEIKTMIASLPADARTVVTSHDAFQYFARDYGLDFVAPQGVNTESEPSARDVAELIKQIRVENIAAVFVESISDERLMQQVANETGAVIGGELFPGALSAESGPAATYLDMMRHNASTIVNALGEAKLH